MLFLSCHYNKIVVDYLHQNLHMYFYTNYNIILLFAKFVELFTV